MDNISAVRSAIHKRNRILKQFFKKKPCLLWKKYKDQRNYMTTLIRETKIKYYEQTKYPIIRFSFGLKKMVELC